MKSRILFVALDARYTHSNPALRSIMAWADAHVPESKRPELLLGEFNINQRSEQIAGEIHEYGADAVFISIYLWNYRLARELIARLRVSYPHLLIGAGGPEISYTIERSFQEMPALDLLVYSEGESAFEALLPLLARESPDRSQLLPLPFRERVLSALCEHPEAYQGLVVRDVAGRLHQSPAPPLIDLDQLPFLYADKLGDLQNRLVYYESSRGCPFHCSYCLSSRNEGLRFRSEERVLKELDYLASKEVPLVKFIDRSFNASPERARRLWQHMIDHAEDPPKTKWHFEIEAVLLGPKDFELLSKAPKDLFQFEIGIQSFNPEVLDAVHRAPQTLPIVNALKTIGKAGNIHCHADLIFGLPGENLHSAARSFRLGLSSGAEVLQLGFLKILKGTAMEAEAERRRFRWLPFPPYEVVQTDALTQEELLQLKRMENVFERVWNDSAFILTRLELLRLNEKLAKLDARLIYEDEFSREAFNSPPENADFNSFDFFFQAGHFFFSRGLQSRPLSLDNFFSVFYDYLLCYGFHEEDPLPRAVRQDYMNLPLGRLKTWERLRQKYKLPPQIFRF